MSQDDRAVREWRQIARGDDVLFDVLSWPEKRGTWTEQDFYATGASDWEDFRRHWDHYWPQRSGVCVEVGCGVGRITSQLQHGFDRVIALDVSADMIERASRKVSADVEFRDNVEFHQVNGPVIPVQDAHADAVFSVHVMQHLESMDVLVAYIQEMRRVLRDGGSLMVHIPLRGAPEGPLGGRVARVREELALWQSRRALSRGGTHSTMRTRSYWLNEVWQTLTDTGFREIELRLIPVRSNGYGHQFWLARA